VAQALLPVLWQIMKDAGTDMSVYATSGLRFFACCPAIANGLTRVRSAPKMQSVSN